jgi:hypothetical protein
VGAFPEKHSPDYCWGGCPGALQEAMHIFKAYYPDVYNEMRKVHYVVGRVEGPLDIDKDEKVIFVGNCTSWRGNINGKSVDIKSSYKSPKNVDERNTKSNDMVLKTVKTLSSCMLQRGKNYIHAKGCPVSVGDHVHYLSMIGGIKNVNFDPRLVVSLNIAYLNMRTHRAMNRYFA